MTDANQNSCINAGWYLAAIGWIAFVVLGCYMATFCQEEQAPPPEQTLFQRAYTDEGARRELYEVLVRDHGWHWYQGNGYRLPFPPAPNRKPLKPIHVEETDDGLKSLLVK